jgi:hypothetical protein
LETQVTGIIEAEGIAKRLGKGELSPGLKSPARARGAFGIPDSHQNVGGSGMQPRTFKITQEPRPKPTYLSVRLTIFFRLQPNVDGLFAHNPSSQKIRWRSKRPISHSRGAKKKARRE